MEYRIHPCNLRDYVACVDWTICGKRKRKYFKSKAQAKTWADLRNQEVRTLGVANLTLPDSIRVQAQEAVVALAPYGKTISDAVAVAIAHWRASEASVSVAVAAKALRAERAKKAANGQRGASGRYLGEIDSRLTRFESAFGESQISDITKGQVQKWLDQIPTIPARNSSHRVLSVLWEFARQRDWCRDNPLSAIKMADHSPAKVEVLTVDQARAILSHAADRFKGLLAVWLFCGPRRSELERITLDNINLDSGLVRIDVTKTRGAARRFVKIRPCLRQWLASYPIAGLSPQQIKDDLERAVKRAKIERWPKNVIRHSFCSYALAHERDINDLTLEMGHTKPSTIFAHYRELVSPQDAAEYWGIVPV